MSGNYTERERVRQTFKCAFETYTQEGVRLRKLLLELADEPTQIGRDAIARQQQMLDEAQRGYQVARQAYVEEVFAEMVAD